MPSKTSKTRQTSRPSLWKEASGYSELALGTLAKDLAGQLRTGDCVLLHGKLGAGKSTFARALLQALKVSQPPEGSPTFAIAHEYHSIKGNVAHIDFYRMESDEEIDEAGISAYFWEREIITISEWISMFPDFEKKVMETHRSWVVTIEFEENPETRKVKVEKLDTCTSLK